MKKVISRIGMLVALAGVLTFAGLNAQAAPKGCAASCPAGLTQSGGSCPAVKGSCAAKCSGSITCSVTNSTGTYTTSVPCTCQ